MKIQNAYVQLLEKDLNQKISSILRSELDNVGREYHNINNSTSLIDDFFSFYFDTLQYSTKEFLDTCIERNNTYYDITTLLFSNYFDSVPNRTQWIALFKDGLQSDLTFFRSAFTNCLETHLHTEKRPYQDNNIKEEHLLRNKEVFLSLIDIGQKEGHFSKLAEKDFYTTNSRYQMILDEKGLSQHQFSISKLFEYLKSYSNNLNSSNNSPFITTYFKDLLTLKNNYPDILVELHQKNYLENFLQLFFSAPYNSLLIEKKDVQETISWIFNDSNSNKIIQKNSQIHRSIIKSYPDMVLPFFESLSEDDKNKMFSNLSSSNDDVEAGSYDYSIRSWFGDVINKDKNDSSQLFYHDDVLDYFYENLQHYNTNKESSDLFGRFIMAYITFRQKVDVNGIEYNTSIEKNYLLLEKYLPVVSTCIKLNTDRRVKDIANLGQILSSLEEFNPLLKDKLEHKLIPHIQTEIYQYFFPKKIDTYPRNYFITNLSHFLGKTNLYSVLDILNMDNNAPEWKKIILKCSEVNESRAKSNQYDYNLPFVLFTKIHESALDWFIQPINLPHLKNMKYRNKTLVPYLIEESWFSKAFNKLIAHPDAFKSLILENKQALKVLAKFTEDGKNPEIKTALSFYKLKEQVKEKENTPVIKRNKI